MRISKRGWRGASALAVILLAAAGLAGLIAGMPMHERSGPDENYASAHDAYRAGVGLLADKDIESAVPALEFAADRGVLGAQLRLAHIYGAADKAHRDDAKAVIYYHMLVNEHGDIDRLHPAAKHVADAFSGLASYYRDGVPEIGLKANPRKAAQLVRHAASYFRDPRAQFEIGKMYAEGDGVAANRRIAISWLLKASQKRYAPAQAYLGEMLWRANADDLTRARGLALLALAVDNAGERERGRITEQYREAGGSANADEIQRAERFVASWDSLRSQSTAHAAVAQLRALRSTPLEAAPVGSLVVSMNGDPFTAQEKPDDITSLLMGGLGLETQPESLPTENASGAGRPAAPHPAEKFFLDHPSLKVGAEADDLFAGVKVSSFSGETLSVEANQPAEK